MNIYLLNGTQTAFLPAHLLVQHLPIKGLIGLENNKENAARNEYFDYSAFCAENSIDYVPLESYTMASQKDQDLLLGLEIDILLTISWQRLIPTWLIEHCRVGAVGSHGSPLGISQGRGRSPQNWALLLGCTTFSYSIFWIDPGVDSGEIIDTCDFQYSEVDDILTSYIKSGLVMANMMINNYKNGNLQRHFGLPQSGECAYYFPQRTREDGRIDWGRSARQIYDFVRALTRPYPGAFTTWEGHTVTIWAGKLIDGVDAKSLNGEPGEIMLIYPGGELLIACGDGLFLVTDYAADGVVFACAQRFESASFQRQLRDIVDRHEKKYSFAVSPLITQYLTKSNGENE